VTVRARGARVHELLGSSLRTVRRRTREGDVGSGRHCTDGLGRYVYTGAGQVFARCADERTQARVAVHGVAVLARFAKLPALMPKLRGHGSAQSPSLRKRKK
jgi:hypothetical protein